MKATTLFAVMAALVATNVALIPSTASPGTAGRTPSARPASNRMTSASAPAGLSRSYTVTLGQMVALSATNFLQSVKPIDAPMMAFFDGQRIEIWVLGTRSTPDGARETLDSFQSRAWPQLVAMIQAQYDIKLTDRQVTVVYRNRDSGNEEIVRWANGRYVEK